MNYYKDALYIAADYAYLEEVIMPDMEHITIGENGEFASKKEWIASRVQEWIDEARLKMEAA